MTTHTVRDTPIFPLGLTEKSLSDFFRFCLTASLTSIFILPGQKRLTNTRISSLQRGRIYPCNDKQKTRQNDGIENLFHEYGLILIKNKGAGH